jgi:murein DD-endopeptidase MepM/ murein hydrolase activator NlpD
MDKVYPKSSYVPINLSTSNEELRSVDVSSEEALQDFIDGQIRSQNGKVGYGGYLERRGIYNRSDHFNEEERNIHLGMDIWAPAGTDVLAALDGTIHSFANNNNYGDYGPTIILEHQFNGVSFYTLYGHLSLNSIADLSVNATVKKGQVIGNLGDPSINGNYPPHLHFQIIHDLQKYVGDYPGVSNEAELSYYTENCPDPNLLLKLG